MAYFWVGLGGALGSMARFWCSGLVANTFGATFPWGTLLVNVVGSFIIGFTSTLTGPEGRPASVALIADLGGSGISHRADYARGAGRGVVSAITRPALICMGQYLRADKHISMPGKGR
jgi:hypothetical protein